MSVRIFVSLSPSHLLFSSLEQLNDSIPLSWFENMNFLLLFLNLPFSHVITAMATGTFIVSYVDLNAPLYTSDAVVRNYFYVFERFTKTFDDFQMEMKTASFQKRATRRAKKIIRSNLAMSIVEKGFINSFHWLHLALSRWATLRFSHQST